MRWLSIVVVVVLIGYVVSETIGPKLREGFGVPRRSDIGPTSEGWTHDETGWIRDMRYSESFADVQGFGVAGDFCRAVSQTGRPETLQVACALATRDGMDTLEYHSRTVGEGFQMSRDDYWKKVTDSGRTDYCRILQDADTGLWFSGCAVAGKDGIGPREIRDVDPPPAIALLLTAYEGAVTWFRWQDDREDYAKKTVVEVHGSPEFPTLIRPYKSRGLQLNRLSPSLPDMLRWGEKDTLMLDQDVRPGQIRAVCFWVWWDKFEKGARILECSNGKKDRVWIGVDSFGPGLSPIRVPGPAAECRPQEDVILAPPTEPAINPDPEPDSAAYVFEIWDQEQRVMRLKARGAATGEWQHVTVTTTDSTTWWPTWQIWLNGALVAEKHDGRSIPALTLANNVIGKHVRGCIQDFRVYNSPMGREKILDAIKWSKPMLHPQP